MTTSNFSSLVFYNNCHNGDLHYSRQFVKYIASKIGVQMRLAHFKCPFLLKDTGIPHVSINTWPILHDSFYLNQDTLFMNTWIGQADRKWFHPDGCTLKNNYRMFTEHAAALGITLLDEKEYIPTINYSQYEIGGIKVRQSKNIMVCNGDVMSGQAKNFNINQVVLDLAKKHKDCDFYVTQSIDTDMPNIIDANAMTKVSSKARASTDSSRSNLNELSFLSTMCDVIVGRGSGPFCFTTVKENLHNPNKTLMCFGNGEREGHWAIMTDYTEQSLCAKQTWRECHVNNDIAYEPLVFEDIDAEISRKYGES